ncbi:MAG: hypothetical protein TR69_WS6001001086 [candidate division WS6 bacterium OLB20]|uniref:Uncharacterized protein n=1 Tax=candidate division WS6 bacterium OLB20 TaxID=1617426 RepID=A0A136LZH9_9BACT|nr:MAG: hypothetical protein TR69_WS6001001086 [candidate division WS6 bacterium OLB20]
MSVDDFAKLLLVIVFSISILGLTYQCMRLLGAFADSIRDLRQVLQAFGDLSDRLVNDYDYISRRLKGVVDSVSGFTTGVVEPLSSIFGFVKNFRKSRGKTETQPENDFADIVDEETGV